MTHYRTKKNQRGVAMVFLCVSIVALCAVAALAVDEGIIWMTRNKAQIVADSAALAAARDLSTSSPSTALIAANADAKNVATAYSSVGKIVLVSDPTVTFPTSYTPDCGDINTTCKPVAYSSGSLAKVQVTVRAPAAFGAVVGQSGVNVKATAYVQTVGVSSYSSAVPWGLVADNNNPNTGDHSLDQDLIWLYDIYHNITPPDGTDPAIGVYQTHQITLKDIQMNGSTIQSDGNFGAIDLVNSNGGNDYRTNIGNNSSQNINIGDVISTLTGNKQGPTGQGIDDRLLSTNTAFDHYFSSYDDWFYGRSTYPAAIDPSTGRTLTDAATGHTIYADPYRQDAHDARVVVVPLITTPGKNGSSSVTVLGFAVFFMESIPNSNKGDVTGRFIGMNVDGSAPTGSGTGGGGGAVTSQLVE